MFTQSVSKGRSYRNRMELCMKNQSSVYGRERDRQNRLLPVLRRVGILLVLLVLLTQIVSARHNIVPQNVTLPETPNAAESGSIAPGIAGTGEESAEPPEAGEPTYTPPETGTLPEEPEGPETLTLVAAGDVLLHMHLQNSGLQEDGSYDYSHLFAHTKDLIAQADLAVVNQEVILGGKELGLSGYPRFNGAFEVGDAVAEAGFDIVLHANNHALDKDAEGLLNCLEFWRTSHPEIAVLGIHDSQEDQDNSVYFYPWGDYTIAFLNYTYGTNGIKMPEPYMVDLLKEDKVRADLQKANEQADFIVVLPHWGVEYALTPNDEQRKWVQFFLENGVDLVIGAHPHVIEPVEWVEDDQGNRMLVYYSLGNYVHFTSSAGSGVSKRSVGALAQVTLAVEDGRVVISDYGVTPLVMHLVRGTGAPTVYPLSEYTEELAKVNDMKRKDSAFSLAFCKKLCQEVFADLYHS